MIFTIHFGGKSPYFLGGHPSPRCLGSDSIGGLGGPWSDDGHRERGDDASGQNLEILTSIATP